MDAIMVTFKIMIFDIDGIKLKGHKIFLNCRLVILEIFNLPWKKGIVDCDTKN